MRRVTLPWLPQMQSGCRHVVILHPRPSTFAFSRDVCSPAARPASTRRLPPGSIVRNRPGHGGHTSERRVFRLFSKT
jgi:hypothetical protein